MWNWFEKSILQRSDIYFGGSRYMRRWLFGSTNSWGIRIHCIERSDADRELHDHPFWFVSFILSGGYYEHTPDGRRTWYGPGSIVFRSADTLHRLELAQESVARYTPAWTFVIRGRYARLWGFLDAGIWTTWQKFVGQRRELNEYAKDSQSYRAPSSL